MIRIGLFGAGHLGKIHLRLLQESPDFELIGFHDPDPDRAAAASDEFGLAYFDTPEALIQEAEAVDVVSATLSHYDIGQQALRASKHVFVEKPLAEDAEKARKLAALQKEAGVVGQVGHVERFNPAFLAIKDKELQPMFIESHRLAQWNPRGADVSVVLDLMIHDLDIVLSLVRSSVKRVSASGVAVISSSPDIANARLEFNNGCVVNLTASRISMKNMRKMRIFQPHAYLTVDFLEKKSEIFNLRHDKPAGGAAAEFEMEGRKVYLQPEFPEAPEVNSIGEELAAFARSIREGTPPPVSFHDGYQALALAEEILTKVRPAGS
jgi:predicted dehydrogenase